jgi:hypothetical protein
MKTLHRYEVWHGRAEPPPETHELRAGPVTALLEGPDLRHVRLGAVELAQRIYMAVRDEGWNTVPGTYSDLQLDIDEDHFRVELVGRHRYGDLDYEWKGTIIGTPDGTISYAMEGVTHSTFRYNKIGFNVHHPLPESVGQPYRARTSRTSEVSGTLPEIIDPQRIENGTLTAMFAPYGSLTIVLKGGVEVQFDFEGDLFEMQDHRNWTDANYKSYGTPLAVPYPMDAQPGQELHQKVTVSVIKAPDPVPQRPGQPRVELGRPLGRGLPSLGVGLSSQGGVPTEREATLLRNVHLDHVRVDLHLNDSSYRDELERAVQTARGIGAGLELALFVSRNAEDELIQFASLIQRIDVAIRQVLVLEEAEGFSTFRTMTPAPLTRLARERLGSALPGVLFAGGTDQFFTELNRDWSQIDAADAIVYSLNPQVHAADDSSLMENLQGQADTVRSTRHFCGDRPIFVSPITFVGRTGPFPAGPPEPGGLPGQVDVRQASLFGAAWTVGAISELAEVGAGSLTFFEATGWRGIMERDAGSPMPDRFPSSPDTVFPMYHVFADVGEWKDGMLVEAHVNDPLAVTALAVQTSRGVASSSRADLHMLVANLTPRTQAVELGPLGAWRQAGEGTHQGQGTHKGHPYDVRIRRMDEETVSAAMSEPNMFRQSYESIATSDGRLQVELPPYAVARLEVSHAG